MHTFLGWKRRSASSGQITIRPSRFSPAVICEIHLRLRQNLEDAVTDYRCSRIGGIPQAFIVSSHKIKLSYWLPFCCFAWGLLTLSVGFCNHVWQIQVVRFFMGMFESVSFAGGHYILGSWVRIVGGKRLPIAHRIMSKYLTPQSSSTNLQSWASAHVFSLHPRIWVVSSLVLCRGPSTRPWMGDWVYLAGDG